MCALLGATGCGAVSGIQRVAKAADALAHGNKELNAFVERAKKAQSAVYVADYRASGGSAGNASVSTFRIAQKPPKSLFESSDGGSRTVLINDGTDTYSCSGSPMQCLKSAGTGEFSTAAFANYLNPATFVQLLAPLAALANFDVRSSSRQVAGQHSDCVTVTDNNKSDQGVKNATYCTTDNGIFSYASDKDGTVEMTRYAGGVADSEFKLPGKVVDPSQLNGQDGSSTTSTTPAAADTTTTPADATTSSTTSAAA